MLKTLLFLVGRPGLDPGTLGFVCERSGPSLKVQICWSQEVGRSPTFSEILPSLNSWLDEWLAPIIHEVAANRLLLRF